MTQPTGATPLPLSAAALRGDLRRALDEVVAEGGEWAAWRHGWVLTAMGRYGDALTVLERTGTGLAAAAAAVTRASLLRQVALHVEAGVADDVAAHELLAGPQGEIADELRAAAAIGHVADAVGLGEIDRLPSLLDDAVTAVAATTSWRQGIRLQWVVGEVAMAGSRWQEALSAFTDAARLANAAGAARHHAKSLLFVAAASAAAGDCDNAALLAAEALRSASLVGADPIRWPAALVLAGARDAQGESQEAAAMLETATATLGSLLITLPEPLRASATTRTSLLSGLSP